MRCLIVGMVFLLSGCVGSYQLKGYTLGASAGKSIYADPGMTFSDKSYTQVMISSTFQFAK